MRTGAGAARPSMQALLQRRKRAGFVGRRDELAVYRENFDIPVDDDRHRFVFHVRGIAGVGKTTLVREWQDLARGRGALTAYVDESVNSVPEALAEISACCAQQGHPLKALDRQLAIYRQRRYEAEAASAAVTGPEQQDAAAAPSAGGMAIAQAGLIGAGMLPVVGAFAGAVDPARVAQGTDRLRAVLSARFRNQDDVQLVLDPLQALTPVLVAELDRVAAEVPWVALFFDTYERTAPFLDTWLRDLITTEDRYGALPPNVVLTLAGQTRLDPACWSDYAEFVGDIPLEPFTEPESRQLLAAKGVVDETVVQDVLRLAGGLPVLVSTLAEKPGEVDAPSADAVDRFLKWETDPVRRAAALACALPRRLNEDVFAAATETGTALFAWLGSLPFVSEREGHARYHDVVRGPMLRLQRLRSPRRWSAEHTRLAEVFAGWAEAAAGDVPADELWSRETWRAPRLEELYHRLCAQPVTALPGMLRAGVDVCEEQDPATARRWARVLADAGEDTDSADLRAWGRDTLAALDGEERPVGLLGLLLARAGFGREDQVAALVVRGMHHRRDGDHAKAVADYERALALDPDCARAHYGMGLVLRAEGDYAGALARLDRADGLAPDTAWILESRGDVHRLLGQHQKAVADCDRALELRPDSTWALATRGMAKYLMERDREALADLDRAIELEPEYWWALLRRSEVRLHLGDEDGALADLYRAEEIEPDRAWVIGERARLHWRCGRHEQALADFGRALEMDPEYAWARASRALVWESMGRLDEALADLDRAVELKPVYTWALTQRADVHRRLGDGEAERADLDRAVLSGDNPALAFAMRGAGHRLARRYEEAVADFGRAVELDPDYGWAIGSRGVTYRAMERLPEALADLERAALLLPDTPWVLAERETVYRELRVIGRDASPVDEIAESVPGDVGSWIRRASARTVCGRFGDALADFDRALALDPGHGWARVSRAWLRGRLGDRQGQFADLDEVVASKRNHGWALGERAMALRSAGLPLRALADLDRRAALGFDPSWTRGRRAAALLSLDRAGEALAVLEELPPGDRDGELPLLAKALRRLGHFTEAREAAARLAELAPPLGLFHLAMAESRLRGTAHAAAHWRAYGQRYAAVAPREPWAHEVGRSCVPAAALGDWDEARLRLERMLSLRPDWGELKDLEGFLEELAACPGADGDALARLLDPVRAARIAMTPDDDGT
ncbi:tetratricopeptide repeat protein [Streptomyces sp. NPDC049837]|uniref:tetratricopeptide repeat protein n=1 Tax=Streptomyces sp. NPDC049837 TaxID=3155277 RepID=UPI0034320953